MKFYYLWCGFFQLLLAGVCNGCYSLDAQEFIVKVENFLNENNGNVSILCCNSMKKYVHDLGLNKIWAVKMYEARANFQPTRILNGNIVELGFFEECLNIEGKTELEQDISGKYCISKIAKYKVQDGSSNTYKQIQLGECIPDLCSAIDIEYIYKGIGLNREFDETSCQTKETQPKFGYLDIITVTFFGVVLVIIIFSTSYHVFLKHTHLHLLHRALMAFSALNNWKSFVTTNTQPNKISCLDGIRTITTLWLICGHSVTVRLLLFPSRNTNNVYKLLRKEKTELLLNANVIVDTFFLMTGILTAYNYLDYTAIKKNKVHIFLYYLHRYLRLTPVLACVILIHATLLKFSGSGPLWPTTLYAALIRPCETDWWRTLLYIQNYSPKLEMCVPQSWYLALDMQITILSPLLLLPLRKWPTLTLIVIGLLTVCSMVYSFVVSWIFNLNVNFLQNLELDTRWYYAHYYYYALPSRIAPWLIGFITGYFIFKVKINKTMFSLTNTDILLGSFVTAATSFCFFGYQYLDFEKPSRFCNALYQGLISPVWAISIGWIIFACACGNAERLNSILSSPIFGILSKLTYTLYLVHYSVIYMFTADMKTTPVRTSLQELHIYCGDLVISLFVSVIIMLGIERPMITIGKMLLEKKKQQQENQETFI